LFSAGKYGYNVGNTFTDRNLFKEAAILQIKVNASVLYDISRNTTNLSGIVNQDLKIGANLIYPRIISPFHFAKPGKYGVPHTTFSTNYSLFYQDGLVTRNSFITSLTYDFNETANKQHTVTPIYIEFSKGTIDKTAYKELLSKNFYSYIYLIGRTVFTTGSQYTYQYNANQLNTYGNFTYFRGAIDIGGNFLSGVTSALNTRRDTLHQRTLFGYAFAQYAKSEADFRVYRSLGGERQFVFRINPGIGVPYGNSDQLIFEKNFYAGGANDIRAWLPRTLGPGQFNRATAYGLPSGDPKVPSSGDILRSRLKYLDQFGEVKIITNVEYRYKLVNDFFGSILRGALFVDAGNVWRLHKETQNPNGEFRFNNILQSSAIGVGTGLRFDVGFFVFRLDAAFKFKDPEFNGADQWVLINHFNELLHSGTFKKAYFLNNGDTYNFMQLNFGIGMPF
jgi:outer membrane protein insertion porin family